jgi:CheY-like chemotaxis protein/HPt (histidine-containing phosphotransfer) domain-containing protein
MSFEIDELKDEYLSILEENLLQLETGILALEGQSGEQLKGSLFSIFRLVHSIKGSAGTYELFTMTNIFHRFEDHINTKINTTEVAKAVDTFLGFLDLAKKCLEDYENNSGEMDKYVTLIDELSLSKKTLVGKILLVEPTKSIGKIITKVALENRIEVTILENGVTALNRILMERFDLIISSINIEMLDGVSFLSAIRVMKSLNQKTPLVLISSDENFVKSRNLESVEFLVKNSELLSSLDKVIKGIFEKGHSANHEYEFKNIICIEDDLMIQKMIRRAFKDEAGTTLEFAGDYKESVDLLKSGKPDLIVLDCFLKDCTAQDILNKLAELPHLSNTPIVFMTASPDLVDLKLAKKLGNIKGIIEKPIKVRTLPYEISLVALS